MSPRSTQGLLRSVGALLVFAIASLAVSGESSARNVTFAAAAQQAMSSLLSVYSTGDGTWRDCNAADCAAGNQDWGDDSLTYVLALRYQTTHDASLQQPLLALAQTAPTYGAPCATPANCGSWSDVPQWDSIAASDEYQATGDASALAKAEAAFAFDEQSGAYALGACPEIRYQQPGGGDNQLKTLETDANSIKAALLLFEETGESSYLTAAETNYDHVRSYFLDPRVPLYTVYVFDNGATCKQLPHRFFASVNGDMIWSGVQLYAATGSKDYLNEAVASAEAVSTHLSDGRGVFADLQAENDIVEPLVEGMYALASRGQAFARTWIIRNASAALAARGADGSFGRFFDGPPPVTTVTAWQTNGGYALEVAAAALAPSAVVQVEDPWTKAVPVTKDISTLPATIRFRGSAIALLGTLGDQCCEPGHARVIVDGHETFDQTGIWQNKSSSGRSIPNTVLFAWRWKSIGMHTLTIEPGALNGKEGGPFFHLSSYELLLTACARQRC